MGLRESENFIFTTTCASEEECNKAHKSCCKAIYNRIRFCIYCFDSFFTSTESKLDMRLTVSIPRRNHYAPKTSKTNFTDLHLLIVYVYVFSLSIVNVRHLLICFDTSVFVFDSAGHSA